ncbi:MAG: accessory factor UbiK family protein [Gammaproteobacteria bacterium]|jgi:BMFP domain-containing protein YqiC|nr:accessory factor UbiK family protein [Gammaproteobacteria bacterium]
MIDRQFIEELSARIAALMPLAGELNEELRTKLGQLLQKGIAELDLLSREEFQAQASALKRAEERIAELEVEIGDMEKRLEEISSTQNNN